MEERCTVAVALVDLIPQAGDPAGLNVAGHERGLAGTGRAGNPDDGTLPALFEHLEEPLPREYLRKRRPGYFGYGEKFLHIQNAFEFSKLYSLALISVHDIIIKSAIGADKIK